jgi:hypothetical protein
LTFFTRYGTLSPQFSTAWKTGFHTVEKRPRIFHGMENFSGTFPRYGKKVSTVWKKPTP